MSIVAEYDTELAQLRVALRAAPEMTLRHEECHVTGDEEVRWVYWAGGGDRSAFEAGLQADPTVEATTVLADSSEPRLYSTTLVTPPSEFMLTMLGEFDVQTLRVTHAAEGTTVRVRCPSRETYAALRDTVERETETFVTRRLFREEAADAGVSGVTPAQREALLRALEEGYYAVPRQTTLEQLAAGLGVSDQAVSSRLRRGTANLLWDTLARDGTL